jgi:ribosome-binding factor A
VFDGLQKAAGFIRAELGRRVSLRYLPDLMFVKDVSGPRGDRILQLLDSLRIEDPEADGSVSASAAPNSEP